MLQLLTSALINLLVFGIALGAVYWLFFPSRTSSSDFSRPFAPDEVHIPAVSAGRPKGEGGHSAANVGTTAKSPTYRLQGIRADISKAGIPSLLREAWEIPEATDVEVHSLATNPIRPERKIATISFSETPASLRFSKQDEWFSRVDDELDLVLDTHFRGFTPLHSDPDPDCLMDCIAVSGLGGHAFGSFKSKNNSFMWLRDALPQDLPQSRIFLYGYDAESVNSRSIENITDLGIELQHSINQIRRNKHGIAKPLVLIGHSLGGLVVKQAIINMHESQTENDQMNLHSLRAALFFAVPTLGMNIESLIPMVEGNPNEDLVKSLKGTSETLRRQKGLFDNASQSFSKYWYYETKESPTAKLVGSEWSMTGPDALLVDPHSATNGLARSSEPDHHFVEPINRSHSEIVKFPHREDRYYAKVSGHLKCIKGEIPRNKSGRIRLPLSRVQSECVRSLAIENQDSRKRTIDLVPDTCQWIENHPVFQAWERSRTGTLCIRGQPGSGKSSLMKYLADALDCEKPTGASPVVLSFFFHGTGLEVHRSLIGFYSVLLNQLLPEIPQFCHGIFEKYAQDRSRLGERSRWEMQELRDFLSTIISQATSAGIPIILLADALDEAGQSSAMELLKFFRGIESSAKKTTDGIYRSLRICFSCRPYPIIVGPDHESIIDVDQHNEEDLAKFVRSKLQPDPSVRIEDSVLRKAQDEIIHKTGRTFQWANLMIKEVDRMFTEMDPTWDIQQQISKTPSDLCQFYRQLVSQTSFDDNASTTPNQRERALTLKLFQWLCFSEGPLTLTMIQHALVLGPEEPDIAKFSEHHDFRSLEAVAIRVTKLSRGLVEIRHQGSEEIVQFTHQSVYDFLLETGLADLLGPEVSSLEPIARATKVAALGHFQISWACVQAMVMDDTTAFIEKHLPLTHGKPQIFRPGSPSPHSDHEMRTFQLSDCCYSFGLSAFVKNEDSFGYKQMTTDEISAWISQPPSARRRNLIHLRTSLLEHSNQTIPVAFYGSGHLLHHLEALERQGWDSSDLLDHYNETNLASVWEELSILRRDNYSLISLLAESGIISLLRLCLRQDPRRWSIKDDQRRTPLHHVIEYGEDDVIKFLIQEELKRGCIDIEHSIETGRTPLHYAIRFGKEEAARVLIQEAPNHGTVDLNRPNDEGRTPLHYAIECGRKEIVQILIRQTVDVDYPDLQGRTPIFIAALYNRVDEMRYLLLTGMVNVERKDWKGETPLAVAAWRGHTDIASLLLEYGASVESTDDYGRTPLFQAVRRSNMEMTRYLVKKASADVNVLDNQGRSVLSHAAEEASAPITEYIFGIAPIQLEIADKRGKLPIIYATEAQNRGAFEFLKKRIDQHEEALLIKIARYGEEQPLEYILKHGGTFNSETLDQAWEVVHGLEAAWKERICRKIREKRKYRKKMRSKMEGIKQLMENKRNRS